MRISLLSLLLISLLSLLSCEEALNKELLWGQWKGVELLENTEVADLDVSGVRFEFKKDGTYSYTGTLNHREAGRYYILGKVLYSTDTTMTAPKEKAVRIIRFTADSLFFEMNAAGTPQLLKLAR
ncbi:MAG: hypothetical protein AAGG75_22925 [Bacteroidota bacterium]